MADVKRPDFDQRPPEEEVLWVQDAKADSTPEVISPGCLASVRLHGVTVQIKVENVVSEEEIEGVVAAFEPPVAEIHKDLVLGDRVRLARDQVFSCGCLNVS